MIAYVHCIIKYEIDRAASQYTEVLHSSLFIALSGCTCVQLQMYTEVYTTNCPQLSWDVRMYVCSYKLVVPWPVHLIKAVLWELTNKAVVTNV